MPLPKGRKALSCNWVYKYKYTSNSVDLKYNVRIVAKGYKQEKPYIYEHERQNMHNLQQIWYKHIAYLDDSIKNDQLYQKTSSSSDMRIKIADKQKLKNSCVLINGWRRVFIYILRNPNFLQNYIYISIHKPYRHNCEHDEHKFWEDPSTLIAITTKFFPVSPSKHIKLCIMKTKRYA